MKRSAAAVIGALSLSALGAGVLAAPPASAVTVGAGGTISVSSAIPNALTVSGHHGKPVTIWTKGSAAITMRPQSNAAITFGGLLNGRAYDVYLGPEKAAVARTMAAAGVVTNATYSRTAKPNTLDVHWNHHGPAMVREDSILYLVRAKAANGSVLRRIVRGTDHTTIVGAFPRMRYSVTVTPYVDKLRGVGAVAAYTPSPAMNGTQVSPVVHAPAAPVSSPGVQSSHGNAVVTVAATPPYANSTGASAVAVAVAMNAPHPSSSSGGSTASPAAPGLGGIGTGTGVVGSVPGSSSGSAPVDPGASTGSITPAPAPAPDPASAPGPGPAPEPAPAPAPATRWICPDGWTDAGSTCVQTSPYTYSTLSYTYHVGIVGQRSIGGCYIRDASGTPVYYADCREPIFGDIKDPTPAGYEDNGTQWIRKDDPPAGWSDNGTAYERTTSRIEVPA